MESDNDEVESDFRATKTSNRKHKPIRKKKNTASKAKKVKKEHMCLKLITKKIQKKSDTNGNTSIDSVTDTAYSDSKESQTDNLKEECETSHCPSCGKLFDITKLPDHVKACLHDNFEARRLSRARQESEGYTQRSASKYAGEKLSGGRTSLEPLFCMYCGTDLFALTFNQRNLHVNRCLDLRSAKKTANLSKPTDMVAGRTSKPAAQNKSKTAKKIEPLVLQDSDYQDTGSAVTIVEQSHASNTVTDAASQGCEFSKINSKVKNESKTAKKITKAKAAVQNEKFRCSLCLVKVCSSRGGLARHMLHCQKKHKITTACAMALNKHNSDNDFADDEILSQIRRVDNLDSEKTEKTVVLSPKVKKKRHPRKKKKDIETHNEEMLQLALRVSTGDDLERKRSKKRNPKYVIPVMLELSPNTKRQQLEGRFRSITNPTVEARADEIPSTPALPPSNLTNSNVHVSHRNQAFGRGDGDNDQPGPSGILSHGNVLRRETVNTNTNNDSQPSTSTCLTTFCNMLNEELQSPEVSSSNIKHLSLSDNSDTNCLNASDPVPNDQAVVYSSPRRSVKQVQRSNWSLACNEPSTSSSDYRVRNLLSQFDKLSHGAGANHAEDNLTVLPTPDEPKPLVSDAPDAVADAVDADRIDSTLAVMKELDGVAGGASSRYDEAFIDEQISSSQQSESQNLHMLIDNPQFSDAKVYVGEKREVINLHKNILYCNCSELLNEINAADEKCETVFLENYTKREVMPMICFIYSGRIEPLVNAANRDLNLFAKTKELLKKYSVLITDTDQMLLDAAVEQHEIQSQACDKNEDSSQMACQHDDSFVAFDMSVPVESDGNGNKDDLVSEKSDISFSDDLLPRNLTQQDPTFASSRVSFEDNSFQNMSDVSTSDYDLFAYCNKSVKGGDLAQQHGDEVFIDKNESNPNDMLPNEFVADLSNSVFSEDNSVSNLPSFHHGEDSLSVPDLASSSPSQQSKNDSLPKPKKRKKKDATSLTVRKSPRVSLNKRRGSFGHGWHHRNCFCCSLGDNCSEDSPKKSRTSDKLQKKVKSLAKNKSLRKSLLSKRPRGSIRSPNQKKIEKIRLRSPSHKANTRSRSPSHKANTQSWSPSHKANTRKRRSCSQPNLTSTPSTIVTTPKKRLSLPKFDKHSSLSENTKRSVANTNSLEKKKNPNSHQKSKALSQSKSQTIYIGERLPRFKEREHIRSRPEVANMGKGTRGLSRSMNRKAPSNKNSTRKKTSSVPAMLVSQQLDVVGVEKPTRKGVVDVKKPAHEDVIDVKKPARKRGKDESAAVVSAQHNEAVSQTTEKHPNVEPVIKNMTVEDESTKIIYDDANLRISSQHDITPISTEPMSPVVMENVADDISSISIDGEKKTEATCPKQYRFRKVCLASYVLPSPLKQPKKGVKKSVVDDAVSDSNGLLEDDLSLSDSFVEKFLDVSSKSGCESHQGGMSAPTTPVVGTARSHSRESLIYVGPVPITPMPDFQRMATPEVLHRATTIGLKKTLSKVKLKAKLKETYLYHHQIAPERSFVNHEDLGMHDDDDLVNTDLEYDVTVKLTDFPAQTFVYLFSKLPVEEIQNLSTDVVEAIHKSGTLLSALRSRKTETGSIKRGSRQDRARCWDMVTPGRPQYDPKMSAIVSLPEDIQNAITRPLTGCVAKHYIDYKKYQFECLRFLCDEIENLFKERSSS